MGGVRSVEGGAARPGAFRPGAPEYDEYVAGFQLRERHRPALVVAARDAADVVGAVRYAMRQGLPIAVQAAGHGLAGPLRGEGILVATREMRGVEVNVEERTAWVGAGASWGEVIEASSAYGLAPLSGSMPGVGAVSYTLGGGVGLTARRYGFAADHVRRLDFVTADGARRSVTARTEPDLFWAVRGGGGNFGIVIGMEINLMPVSSLFGGGLMFDLAQTPEVVPEWLDWTRGIPDEVTSALTTHCFSGAHIAHVQIAYLGSRPGGDELLAPLRALKPEVDTVQVIPYRDSHVVFSEPDQPHAYVGDNVLLSAMDEQHLRETIAVSGPEGSVPCVVSVRHLGGALSRLPTEPSAVSHRSAAYALTLLSPIAPRDAPGAWKLQSDLLGGWADQAAGSSPNFTFGRPDRRSAQPTFDPERRARLRLLARTYDPYRLLRPSFDLN